MTFDAGSILYWAFPILPLYVVWDFNRKTKTWKSENVRKLLIGIFIFTIIIAVFAKYGLPNLYNDFPDNDLGFSFPFQSIGSNLFELPRIFILLVCFEYFRRWLVENKEYSTIKATVIAIIPYLVSYRVLARIF